MAHYLCKRRGKSRRYLTSPSSLPLADPSVFHSCSLCLFFSFSYTSFHFAARKFGYNAADRVYLSLSSNLAIFSGRACRSKECSYHESKNCLWEKWGNVPRSLAWPGTLLSSYSTPSVFLLPLPADSILFEVPRHPNSEEHEVMNHSPKKGPLLFWKVLDKYSYLTGQDRMPQAAPFEFHSAWTRQQRWYPKVISVSLQE